MSTEATNLQQKIAAQRLLLKKAKGTPEEEQYKQDLIALNKQLKELKPTGSSSSTDYVLKTPKGTRDFNPEEMAIREHVFDVIKTEFKKHGAVTIDTPVFELKDILTGKYGEDSKLIYDLKDQGGELCSLRYDLTVPFARYLAMHGTTNIKRFHIGKVYRRDNPSVQKGRMREFFQCDFDISGVYDPMVPDSQCLVVVNSILKKLEIKNFVMKVNHRMVLDGMFRHCGVSEELVRPISSAVDKLDKMDWKEVKEEMLQKGLEESVADKIGVFVKYSGREALDQLLQTDLGQREDASKGLKELKILYEYLENFGIECDVEFDMSLARGLDYYTGIIYEVVLGKELGVGSIAAGGRYDNLVGMFSGKQVPCVGISIGVERVFAILSKQNKNIKAGTNVYVISPDGNVNERMKICKQLWDSNINAEFIYKTSPKMKQQLSQCEKQGVPIAVIVGKREIEQGGVMVKILATKEETFVKREDLVQYVKDNL